MKKIDIKEFREKGYLQELNRQFLHPLGLALEVVIYKDGTEKLGGIWDYRDDPEGMLFSESLIQSESFQTKKDFIAKKWTEKEATRIPLIGSMIQQANLKESPSNN